MWNVYILNIADNKGTALTIAGTQYALHTDANKQVGNRFIWDLHFVQFSKNFLKDYMETIPVPINLQWGSGETGSLRKVC